MEKQPPPKYFAFDPTIHAGHLITAVTILCCTLGAWYGMDSRITVLERQDVQKEKEIAEVKADAASSSKDMNSKIDVIVSVQREEVSNLRNDMKSWFMSLDQKLDRKADKK